MSALLRITDPSLTSRHVRKVPKIGIGGASRLRPSHTTVRTGPYTAVREVTLTCFDQRRETERFEVGIGESHGEGFAPGNMPGSTTATGRIAQLPRDSSAMSAARRRPGVFHW